MPSLTDTLCTQCGLCCDGSLFAEVELTGRRESTGLELLGLDVEDDASRGALLMQPCAALRGRRCGVYAHRPTCCRTFECRLLADVRRGAVTVERAEVHITEALDGIRRVEALLADVGHRNRRLPLRERCDEALSAASGTTPERERARAELGRAMAAVERKLRTTFLADGVLPSK